MNRMYRLSNFRFLLVLVLLGSPCGALCQANATWFSDARFGMFIHFGLYSIPGGTWNGEPMGRNAYAEWIRMQQGWPRPGGIPKAEYDQLLSQFNPQNFDADAWVREAKGAGMRYVIITAKHHDGFALWNSKVSDYNVVKATPFKRDILAEVTAACRKYGLKVGFYYSHWQDWEYPGGALPPWPEIAGDPPMTQPSQAQFESYWTHKCLPQVEELLVNFHPDVLWFDSWGEKKSEFLTEDRLQRLISLIRRLSPNTLINSRIGTLNGVDFASTNDNEFPAKGFSMPWETSGTLNNSWGYNRSDTAWKPTATLLTNLIGNVSRGGNYQLNVGPTGNGAFQPADVRHLREIGAWLYVNGEGIYGATASSYAQPAWGSLTQKSMPDGSRHLYAFVVNPTPGAMLQIAGKVQQPLHAWLLETGEEVGTHVDAEGMTFELPRKVPDTQVTTVVFAWSAAIPASGTLKQNYSEEEPVWSDEFSANQPRSRPDASNWVYESGTGGWGNQELEDYCEFGSDASPCNAETTNSFVGNDGFLHIIARKDSKGNYTSARLRTLGLRSFQYGRIEARIKLPAGRGIWPSFWMMSDNIKTAGWPACGEMDIMENLGQEMHTNQGSIHGPGFTGAAIGALYTLPNQKLYSEDFHIFGMVWEPQKISYYVDDTKNVYATYTPRNLAFKATWPFDQGRFFLLLNVAVGGSFPGAPDETTQFPQEMLVDYVRVYRLPQEGHFQ